MAYIWNYSDDPMPQEPIISTPPWIDWDGKYLVEGDSNIQLMNVRKFIHQNCFNIGLGGDVPQGVIDQFPQVLAHHEDPEIPPIEKAYIQVGANLWAIMNPWDMVPQAEPYSTYLSQMERIIELYKTILPPEDIVIASLPFIRHDMTVKKLPGWAQRYPAFINDWGDIIVNDTFAVASVLLEDLCQAHGVHYYNIFILLKQIWENGFSSWLWWATQEYYWDSIHYDTRAQFYVGNGVKNLWGI